jgi:hypothetical protein
MSTQLTKTPEKVTITIKDGALTLDESMTFDQWCGYLFGLKFIHESYHRSLGALAAFGKTQFGEAAVHQAFEQLEFDLGDAQRALSISHATGISGRKITSEHLYILGREFPDDDAKQQEWAAKVEKHDLKPSELKTSISAGVVVPRQERTEGFLTLEYVAIQFQRSMLKLRPTIGKMDKKQIKQTIRILEPIVKFVNELQTRLEEA